MLWLYQSVHRLISSDKPPSAHTVFSSFFSDEKGSFTVFVCRLRVFPLLFPVDSVQYTHPSSASTKGLEIIRGTSFKKLSFFPTTHWPPLHLSPVLRSCHLFDGSGTLHFGGGGSGSFFSSSYCTATKKKKKLFIN